MRNYNNDAWRLNTLVNYGRDYFLCGCDKVYLNTNEQLKEILESFDFYGKFTFEIANSVTYNNCLRKEVPLYYTYRKKNNSIKEKST